MGDFPNLDFMGHFHAGPVAYGTLSTSAAGQVFNTFASMILSHSILLDGLYRQGFSLRKSILIQNYGKALYVN
jgi:hypothetical protein